MHMSLDFERSRERVERQEEKRAEKLGAGLTMQGQAVVDRYLAPLTDLITADFKDRRRNRAVRSALTPMKPDGVAFRLLVAGVTLSLGDRYGVDENGDKTKIDQALWIGDNFGLWGEPGYRVGAWGLALLCRLDRFKMVDGRLCLVDVTGDLEPLLSATIINAAEHNPLVKPLGYEPTPWTGFRVVACQKTIGPRFNWFARNTKRPKIFSARHSAAMVRCAPCSMVSIICRRLHLQSTSQF